MKTNFKFVWLCFIALASVSCKKDKTPCDPTREDSPCYQGPREPQPGDTLLISEYTRQTQYGKTYFRNTYNDKNQLTRHTQYSADNDVRSTIEYTYNEQGHLARVIDKNEFGRAVRLSEYSYHDAEGRPGAMTESMPDQPDEIIYDWTFMYSPNKLIQYAHPRGEILGGFTETYVYNDKGDIISFEMTAENYFHKEVMSNFDGKIRANKYGNPYNWRLRGMQNHLQIVSILADGTEDHERSLKYTYNNAGYPLTTEVYQKATGELIETYTYTYQAAR